MKNLFTIAALSLFSSTAFAGELSGSRLAQGWIEPNHYQEMEMRFRGKENAKVEVFGQGTGELNCRILNSKKEIVMYDDTPGTYCHFDFVPPKTEEYYLIIINLGGNRQIYSVATN